MITLSDLRVLQVLYRMQIGGIQTFLISLHRVLAQNGIQFDYLLKSENPDYFDEEIRNLGGRIYHVPYNGNIPVLAQKSLHEFYAHHEYQIAHFHFGFLRNLSPLIVAEKAGVPTRILHAHTAGGFGAGIKEKCFFQQHRINKNLAYKHATDLFACSEATADWFGFQQQKDIAWKYIPNGIDCDRFVYDKDARTRIRKALGIEKDELCIGHVGRLSHPKNHLFLLRAFRILRDRRPNTKLLLVGDGELRNDIEQYINSSGLDDSVRMLGACSDPSGLYNAMDAFAFPSLFEGLGLALVEAQSNGLPVVASGAIPKEALICKSAVVEDQLDEHAWAVALDRALQQGRDPMQLNEVIRAGFDINKVAHWLENYYRAHFGDTSGARGK